MTLPIGCPLNWREYETTDERDLTARWMRFGWTMLQKVGRHWDSCVPGAPLFKTKKAAGAFLDRFVCDAIPLRCAERSEAAGYDGPRAGCP